MVAFYRAFSFHTSTYVVLELCPNGSLADMLKKRKYLTLPEIRRFVIQICGAVKYLHHRHIVHRDLKTGNLFLDENMNVKVGDFGLAALLVTEKEMEVKRRTTMCGTPNYLAPEILEKGKGHDEKVDLWAIGVIAYTLAVGKAPFHASTKDEIYKKLKTGTYTWPELSATTNQSADLRNLVGSLLVPEEERPIPDQIVSQNFFKIAYVPSSIPSSAREKAPKWPEVTIPSPDVVRRGYSDTWYAICKESGVGSYAEGKNFKLNGGKRVKSIVHDMAAEAQLGLTPTMPIPKDVVYTSTVTNWDAPNNSLQEEDACQEIAIDTRTLKEISHNEVANDRKAAGTLNKAARDAELMPPPSRVGRSATVRKAARTISEEKQRSKSRGRVSEDEPAPIRMPKTRPTAATATQTLKEMNASSSSYQSARSQQANDEPKEKPAARTGTVKRSADASLARRPRAKTTKERPKSPDAAGPLATLDELNRVSPLKKSRRKQAEPEVVEILSDPEPDQQPTKSQSQATANKNVDIADAILTLPPPPPMSKSLPRPRKPSSTHPDPNTVTGTDPSTVLSRLSTFRDNLSAALSNTTTTRNSSIDAEHLPFVSRWVDYSRKHGVGYVLADGTVGCIINASSKHSPPSPVTHVLVRNGQKWLSRVGKNFERIDALPLEILEDAGEAGIKRKIYKGLGAVKEGPLAAEAERRRTLAVLWVKFGRYMCQSLEDGGAGSASAKNAGGSEDANFVRFYQRIGTVGLWAFSDGSLQCHFPDHTKLVFSAKGTHISATCISPEAASYLSSNSDLLPHHVSSREVYADSVHALLHEGGRVRARIVRANALVEKVGFVRDVVGQWIGNGGLGRLDEDDGAKGAKLYW